MTAGLNRLTVAEGDNWFINWADFPSVIGLNDGSFAAHWLVKSGSGTYAYDVNISRSRDGKTWSKPLVPHSDNTKTEHGFVSLVPLSDGRLGAIWLDGRNMKDMKDDHDEDKPSPVNMTLRYATIDANGKISDEAELDERVCECCQTSAALSSDGIVAVYRDRSSNEVRDIYTVGQTNGAWRTPQAVHADNWEINGCPVNGPSIAAAGKNVAVAWYTEAGGKKTAKIAFSTDAGKTFGIPIQFDDGETQGRVDVVLLPDGSALVCWLAGTRRRRRDKSAPRAGRRETWTTRGDRTNRHLALERISAHGTASETRSTLRGPNSASLRKFAPPSPTPVYIPPVTRDSCAERS